MLSLALALPALINRFPLAPLLILLLVARWRQGETSPLAACPAPTQS